MSVSKIQICNLALALLGADSIRSFDENNKRARMCDVFFDITRDTLLTLHDWSFARKFKWLNQLVTDEDLPEGEYVFQKPSDCAKPLDVYPKGSRQRFDVRGDRIYANVPNIGLYYTSKEINTYLYTDDFVHLLSLALAIKLCMPITQDKTLLNILSQQFEHYRDDAVANDANVGEQYRYYDEDPENDTFVNGPYPDNQDYS